MCGYPNIKNIKLQILKEIVILIQFKIGPDLVFNSNLTEKIFC